MLERMATKHRLTNRIMRKLLLIRVAGKTRPTLIRRIGLSHVQASGDVDRFAGEICAVVARQEGNHASHVLGRAGATQRSGLDDILEGLRRRVTLMKVRRAN